MVPAAPWTVLIIISNENAMPNFHRYYIPHAYVFITCVTKDRNPYLESDLDVELFWKTLARVKIRHPFNLFAYVILPDHFHWIMKTGDSVGDFSKVIHSVKWNFTRNYKHQHGITDSLSIWQSRYWDHVIRDEDDLQSHFDYIHWKPVKHGLVDSAAAWQRSSFSFWYERGVISEGWDASGEPESIAGLDLE